MNYRASTVRESIRKQTCQTLTLHPRSTAMWKDMSWSGMTVRTPWRQSTVCGTSKDLKHIFLVSSSPFSQITIGRPSRAVTCCSHGTCSIVHYGMTDTCPSNRYGGSGTQWSRKAEINAALQRVNKDLSRDHMNSHQPYRCRPAWSPIMVVKITATKGEIYGN